MHALLQSGKTPSKKEKNQKDVRAYLCLCTINKADLLVCRKPVPFQSKPAELIVIPRSHAFTFAKALHVKLDHPLPHQFRLRFARQYCILDEKNILQSVYDTCDVPCQATRILPKETLKFATETKPEVPGNFLNADVMIESKQKVLVVRDNLTSFTQAALIPGEKKETLKEALFTLSSNLRLGPTAIIRVDSHSSLASLHKDGSLQQLGFTLDLGHPKNVNKNSPAERAIKDLREQLVRISPQGGPFSPLTLARAIDNLNNLIRHSGRSARELWMCRDSLSGCQLDLKDSSLSNLQFSNRQSTLLPSARYKSRGAPEVELPKLIPGDSVLVKSDRDKGKARDTYSVLHVDHNKSLATLQKFPMTNFRRNPIPVSLQNILKLKTRSLRSTT